MVVLKTAKAAWMQQPRSKLQYTCATQLLPAASKSWRCSWRPRLHTAALIYLLTSAVGAAGVRRPLAGVVAVQGDLLQALCGIPAQECALVQRGLGARAGHLHRGRGWQSAT